MEDVKRYMHENNNDNQPEVNSNTLSYSDQQALIFHLLYAMDSFDYESSLQSVVDGFYRGYNVYIPTESPVFKQVQAMLYERDELDEKIKPLITNWRYDRLGIMTRIILRMGTWELLNAGKDSVIIINESINLAKCFAERDSYKFINGVLDEVVNTYIETETKE
jgi:N utilization substance protein B